VAFHTIKTTLAARVRADDTFVVPYLSGTVGSDLLAGTVGHAIIVDGATYTAAGGDFSVSLGASSVTITWTGDRTLPRYSKLIIQLERAPAGSLSSQATPFTLAARHDGRSLAVTGGGTVTVPAYTTLGADYAVTLLASGAAITLDGSVADVTVDEDEFASVLVLGGEVRVVVGLSEVI
jgi:hypothetical protein